MGSLLNSSRPPVFCPGCSHERIVHALDQALQNMNFAGEEIAVVSDIGCSGLFDTFFNTHAFHGLHGRALTYATGIKMARPNLKVVVTMGDGGLGIGGAHVLSTCRRNLDLTLLVLNNFNYGMTGGQCSSTTPKESQVESGFLNRLEKPVDICEVAAAAGAGWVTRASTYEKGLVEKLEAAIRFEGFSVVDIWGICPGRYTKRNKLTPQIIEQGLGELPSLEDGVAKNARMEYGKAYREEAGRVKPSAPPLKIDSSHQAPFDERQEVVFLGSAGQRILTAGELLCLAGATAGRFATQKNDYPITVMRGHSVTEIILDKTEIGYTGIENPSIVIALAQEGVNKRKSMFGKLSEGTIVLKAKETELPPTPAKVTEVDFKALKIKPQDWALASLAWLANRNAGLSREMLTSAIALRFKGKVLESSMEIVNNEWNLRMEP
jgi:2-oxoglutarate/2-oxoacid ferredoxin oxidoreductase subunit beta